MRTNNPVTTITSSTLSSRISSLSFAEVSIRKGLLTGLLSTKTNDGKISDKNNSNINHNNEAPFFIIGGIDSNTHPLHEAVLKYLVLGSSDIYEPTLQPQYNHLDDTVLMGTQRDITVINTLMDNTITTPTMTTTNNNNNNSNNLYSLHKLRGLKMYRVSSREREGDGEVAELYKILSFVDLVTAAATTSSTGTINNGTNDPTVLRTPLETNMNTLFDTAKVSSSGALPKNTHTTTANNIVETWPLVQAYALQDIGPGGFFTMRYQLHDTSKPLIHIFAHMDTHNVKKLLWSSNNMLIRQYRAFESTLTQIRNTGRRGNVLTCESISEPLVSYYEFASMQRQGQGSLTDQENNTPSILSRGAGVLVGRFTDTINQGVTNSNNGAIFSLHKCGYTIEKETTINLPPVHCIVQSDDPTTGLRVCRTVALGSGRSSTTMYGQQLLHSIFTLYALLSEGYRYGLTKLPVPTVSVTPAQYITTVREIMKTTIEHTLSTKRSQIPSTLTYNTSILIDCDILNAQGQSINRTTLNSSLPFPIRYLYYITVAITNLKDTQYNIPLGSIAIGDTCVITSSSTLLPASPFSISTTGNSTEILPALLVPAVPDPLLLQRSLAKANSTATVASVPIVRVLTAHVPLSHVFVIGGTEGEEIHTLSEAVTQVSSLLTPSNISSSITNTTVQDPFTVGSYGGGVGKGRKIMGTNNDDNDITNVTPKPDIETLNQNVTNTMLSKLSQTRLQEIKNAYTDGTYEALVASLGSSIPNGVYHNVTLLTGGTVVNSITGTLKLHEKGCILLSPAIGPVIISMTEHVDSSNESNDTSSNKGLYVILGNDILTNQINLPSRNNDTIRQGMVPWIDNNQDTVNEAAKSVVDAFITVTNSSASTATSSATSSSTSTVPKSLSTTESTMKSNATPAVPVTMVPTAATETLLGSPSDLLIFRTRSNTTGHSKYTLAGTVSSSSTIACGNVLGLVLPANSELRSSIFEIINTWRDNVPDTLSQPTAVPVTNSNDTSSTNNTDYLSKGLLPLNFILGYVRTCPFAWAWTMAWEDCYLLETLLRNDVDMIQSIVMQQQQQQQESSSISSSSKAVTSLPSSLSSSSATASSPSVPVYVISGVAGSYSSKFAHSMMEVSNSSRPGTVAVIDCNDPHSQGLASVSSFTVDSVNTVIQTTLQRYPKLTSLLFVAPYHTDPLDIVNILGHCTNIVPSGNITVINPKQVYMDQRRTQYLPSLMESVSSGWCQALVCIGDTTTGTNSSSSRTVSDDDDIERVVIGPSKVANPSLQIIRVSNILNKFRLFSLSLPTVQSLLREVPILYTNNKATMLRNIALPGWAHYNAILHRSSTILHVYAPQGRNYMSGATLSAEGDPTVRRVLSFMNVPCASTISFSFPSAVEESSVYSLLRKLVVPYVDRPASVCLELDYNQQHNNTGDTNETTLVYQLPGLCVPVTVQNNIGNAGSSTTVTEGEVFITAWHVTGYIRCTTNLPTVPDTKENTDEDVTDLTNIRPALIKDDYVDSDNEEENGTKNDDSNPKQETEASINVSSSNIVASVTLSKNISASSPPAPIVYPTEALLYAIDATPHAIKLTLVPTELHAQCIPHVQLSGVGLGIEKVKAHLYSAFIQCRPSLPTVFTERTVPSLSIREISTIVRVHAADCLPADVTYDGAGSYFDMEGKLLPGHPLAISFATRHMIMYNAVCTIRNRFVSLCQTVTRTEEHQPTEPDNVSTIIWPTEKDEVDLHTAIEEANRIIPSLPPVQLTLPVPVPASWWIHVQRMDIWLKYIPINVSALRF